MMRPPLYLTLLLVGVPAEASSIGLSSDVALPSALSVGVLVRPVPAFRMGLSASTHGFGVGGRLDVNVRAPWKVAPALNLEAGIFPPADANPVLRRLGGDALSQTALLEAVGYRYASARGGLDFGNNWAVLYVHAGMSVVRGVVGAGEQAFDDEGVLLSWDPVVVNVVAPTARAGLIIWLKGG